MTRVYLAIAASVLAGCVSNTSPQSTAYTAAQALTIADQAALVYVSLPRCTVSKPPCSVQATVDNIKKVAQVAHDTVKAAELGTATPAAAQAAVATLVSTIPTH